MKVYEKYRKTTKPAMVDRGSGSYAKGEIVPQIRIEGGKLASAGFLPGSNYKIDVAAGKLILTLLEA